MISSVFSQIYAPYFPASAGEKGPSFRVLEEVAAKAGEKWAYFEKEWSASFSADLPPSLEGSQKWDEATLRQKIEELLSGEEKGEISHLKVFGTLFAISAFVLFLLALVAFPYLAIPGFFVAIAAATCSSVLEIREGSRYRLIDEIALQGFFFAKTCFDEGPTSFYGERLEKELFGTIGDSLSYLEEREQTRVNQLVKVLAAEKLKGIGEVFAREKGSDQGLLASQIGSSFAKGEMPDWHYQEAKQEILREVRPFLAQVISLEEAVEKGSLERALYQTPRELLLDLTRKARLLAETAPISIATFPTLEKALLEDGWEREGIISFKSDTVSFCHPSLPKLELQFFLQPSSPGNPAAFLLKPAMAEKLAQASVDLGLQKIEVARITLLPFVEKENRVGVSEGNLPRVFALMREKTIGEKPLAEANLSQNFWTDFEQEMKLLIKETGFSCSPEALVYDVEKKKVIIVDSSPRGGELFLSSRGAGFAVTDYARRQKDAPLQFRVEAGLASFQNLLFALGQD